MKSIKDYVNIAYHNAYKQSAHTVYPQHDDLAQNSLANLVARNYKHPTTTLKYSMLNDFNRKTLPAYKESYKTDEYRDECMGTDQMFKTIDNKIFLKEFMAWLPSNEDRYVWEQYLNHDRTMSDIGKEINKSRAVMSWYKIKIIEAFKSKYDLNTGGK